MMELLRCQVWIDILYQKCDIFCQPNAVLRTFIDYTCAHIKWLKCDWELLFLYPKMKNNWNLTNNVLRANKKSWETRIHVILIINNFDICPGNHIFRLINVKFNVVLFWFQSTHQYKINELLSVKFN